MVYLYEHHRNRKYSDNLDESAEGFFGEEFYQTDSEQGSDAYYRKHQEVQRERAPGDVVPDKDLERNFQQIDNEEELGVNADIFHLLLAHREQINRHYWSGSIANHRGETAEQTEEGRITIYASICFPCRIFRSKSSPPSPGRASNPSVGGIPVLGRACQQKVLREILIRLLARALPQSSNRLCACSKPQP